MGVFDQAARYAAKADAEVLPRRLLAGGGLGQGPLGWFDTRNLPRPAAATGPPTSSPSWRRPPGAIGYW